MPWLVFGSFSSGIQLVPLDVAGARSTGEVRRVAARPEAGNVIQQGTIVRRESEYYLFVSFDFCCRGVDSTHYIVVGRSSALQGPYLDRDGRPLLEGGGTVVLAGDARFSGPGSNVLLQRGTRTYNVYHAYDVNDGGRATLRIAELTWDAEGWPISAGP